MIAAQLQRRLSRALAGLERAVGSGKTEWLGTDSIAKTPGDPGLTDNQQEES